MNSPDRRTFIRASAVTASATLMLNRRASAADTMVVGLMGCGGRGTQLIQEYAKRSDVAVKYICDVDQSKFARTAAAVEAITGDIPKRLTDFRKILDDAEVDILINATPDHWHGVGTVWACQAGKHVYVEKPVSHNIWEGRKMVEAARKYKRVVQVGMQNRSAAYAHHAVQMIKSGKIGQPHQARVVNMLNYRGSFEEQPVRPVPDGLDWDMYSGPAPLEPFRNTNLNRVKWIYSAGPIFDDAIHQLDVARWVLGVTYPQAVHTAGGIYVNKDTRDAPDSEMVTWEYKDLLVSLQGSLMCPYMAKTSEDIRNGDMFPEWLRNATRVEIYGTEGLMIYGRQGGGWQVFGPDGGILAQEYGRHELDAHIGNFIDCIRSGKRPNADIEEGHISAALAHMSNISYRLGNRHLQWDGERERFIGDEAADKLLKREYRKPWVIPEDV